MITINERGNVERDNVERSDVAERDHQGGLLAERVEQDLADTLSEFGSRAVKAETEQAADAAQVRFGYGIPMAGVRYYSFTPHG